jgi:hypothetical protein
VALGWARERRVDFIVKWKGWYNRLCLIPTTNEHSAWRATTNYLLHVIKLKKHNKRPHCWNTSKILERGKIGTHNTRIHDRWRSWFSTSTKMRSGRVELVLWPQNSLLVKWSGDASAVHVWVKCQPSHIIWRNSTVMY